MQMKFDYSSVKDNVNRIESELKKVNKALNELKVGIEFMTSTNNWNSSSKEYIVKESKNLYSSMESVELISNDINSYLDGVMSNYNQIGEGIGNLFSSFFGGKKNG